MRQALLTTVPSDSHSWPLVFIEMFLEENHCQVENLGTCVPFDLVVETCKKSVPDVVVLSTVNGHGYMEGVELARRLGALPERSRMKLVAGGKLGTDQEKDAEYAAGLREAGFDAVYYGPDALTEFVDFLEREVPLPAAAAEQQQR